MASNVATLGLAVDATGALRALSDFDKATAKTGATATKAATEVAAATGKITATVRQQATDQRTAQQRVDDMRAAQARWLSEIPKTTAAVEKQNQAVRQQAIDLTATAKRYDAYIASLGGAAAATNTVTTTTAGLANAGGKTDAMLARLRPGFASLATQMLGTNSAVGVLSGTIGTFALGNAVTIGILAGIAAIGFAYDLLTKKSRETKKATEEAVKALEELSKAERLGAGGDTFDNTEKVRADRDRIVKQIESLKRTPVSATGAKTGINNAAASNADEIAELEKQLKRKRDLIAVGERQATAAYVEAQRQDSEARSEALAELIVSGNKSLSVRKEAQARLVALQQTIAAKSATNDGTLESIQAINRLTATAKTLNAALNPKPTAEFTKAQREAAAALKAYDAAAISAADANKALNVSVSALEAVNANTSRALDDYINKKAAEAKLIDAGTAARAKAAATEAAALDGQQNQLDLLGKTAAQVKQLQDQFLFLAKLEEGFSIDGAAAFVRNNRTIQDATKSTGSWADSLRDVNSTLQSLGNTLNGTGSNAVKALGLITGAVEALIKAQQRARDTQKSGTKATTADRAAGALSAGAAGLGAGFAVGSQTQSRTAGAIGGALSGAASGALAASPAGGLGVVAGAIIGGLTGLVGGIIGAAQKGNQAAAQMREAQVQIRASLEGLRATFANDQLGAAIAQAQAQFAELRKGTEAAFAGKKNEAERNRVLAELNVLEAKRIEVLKAEYAEVQKRAQQDLEVRKLIAEGQDAIATAAAFRNAQEREYADAVKAGADATTLAAITATQFAEAIKFAADEEKKRLRVVEDARRTISDFGTATLELSDPRAANQIRVIEDANRRMFDAIERGASAGELAAIAFYNAAVAAAAAAAQLEADTRTSESLTSRGLKATGFGREGDNAAFAAGQRQELVDAVAAGISPANRLFLEFVQFAEESQRRMEQAIVDGTNRINEKANNDIAANQLLIDVIRETSQREIAALDAQIEAVEKAARATEKAYQGQIDAVREAAKQQTDAIDAQIEGARASLDVAKAQLSELEKSVASNQRVVDALTSFTNSQRLGNLSSLSPEAKLTEARRQFEAQAALAQGGSADAAASLPGAANALLEASRAFNASNSGFVADESRVTSVIAQLTQQFGATLPIDIQALEAARATVSGLERSIDALGKQKDAIQRAAEKQIQVLQAAKDKAAADAAAQLDSLRESRDILSAVADKAIKQLEGFNTAIRKAADDQIAALNAIETRAHQDRLALNDYFVTFLNRTGVNPGAGTSTFVPGGTVPVQGSAPVIPPDSAAQTATVRVLERVDVRLDALNQRIDALMARSDTNSDEETAATRDVRAAVIQLAQETRQTRAAVQPGRR